jgi:prepilin peptidase CpaA
MGDWSLQQSVFALAVGLFSLATAWWDFRTHKVPNWLTFPMFLAGWGYQWQFAGWDGVTEAAIAFGLGFGTMLVLWLMGSSGGGDLKLMGALSVWLGLRLTIIVMAVSSLLVVAGTVLLGVGRMAAYVCGWRPKTTDVAGEPIARPRRMVMAYAIPVAFATWAAMAFELPPM